MFKMKNISKRTKIILAIVGVLVVVVAAVAIFAQAGGRELFGATALVITPSNPTIAVGQTVGLSVNSVYPCTWTIPPVWGNVDAPYISLVGYYYTRPDGSGYILETKSVTVKGERAGSTTVAAHCGWSIFNVNPVTTNVTVTP
jgi:hypothetical protein